MAMALPVVIPLAAGACEIQVEPFEVRTLLAVPGATTLTTLAPLPRITLSAVKLADPVPPY